MDSLLSKMGPLKALVPVKHGRHSEGTDASQMQTRSVHVCVCRSPSAHSKASSAVASSTPPMQETSTDSVLSPLPLPSSRTMVPPPLRFLWFNRRSSDSSVEDREREHGHSTNINNAEVSSTPLSTQNDEDGESSLLFSSQSMGESISQNPVHANEKTQKQMDTSNGDFFNESSKVASMHLDSIDQPIAANEGSPPLKSWISWITDFKKLWHSRNALNVSPDTPTSGFSSAKDDLANKNVSDCEGSCDSCDIGCSLEVSYTKVLHTKETFLKFLEDAPLEDMKVLSQMSFLCDMAYTIPDIQPGQLLKYHKLKFITSSLVKKAEAETKLKVTELQKKASRNDNKFVFSDGASTINEGNAADSDVATCSLEAESTLPCTTDGSQVNALNKTDLVNVEPNVNTPHLQEDLECMDDESLKAVAPVAAMELAEEETKLVVTKDFRTSSSCPCEWFICDEESTQTRFFVIQGSESVASWQTNLFFEPTTFEGLDVIVHRGIYEAANALYEQVLPEVLAHFSAYGELTQVRFTGHSLGGSLATLLALMFQIRGVLPRKCIRPVVTFGSPCIMCGGDSLLHKMGLPADHIQSIIMHRDVVPRAFSCDYPDRAAQILKRLNGKFRDHPCLNSQKLLYAPMGQLLILQPDESTAPYHPLLPCGHGLYLLRHPSNEGGVDKATELRGAQRAFLNMPHPLEILSDPGAYGLNGAISRDHNPRSYTKAIHVVLLHEAKRWRKIVWEQRRRVWWPTVERTSRFVQRGQNSSSIVDHDNNTGGALTLVICKSSWFSGHPTIRGQFSAFNRIGFTLSSSALFESQRAAVSRYARLIASKHVQVGMFVIVSLRVVVIECLRTIYVWI